MSADTYILDFLDIFNAFGLITEQRVRQRVWS